MTKQHYHLITGTVIFKEKEQEALVTLKLNGILVHNTEHINMRLLGKSQQILQMNFRQKFPEPSTEIVDVILDQYSYLGAMTETEFKGVL